MAKTKKTKLCKICATGFSPWSTTQTVCSTDCAKKMAGLKAEARFKKRTRELKKQRRENDKAHQRERAIYYFNRFIRLRDRDLPCISCGKFAAKYDAGHYKTAGGHPELRFNELNCHKQCSRNCNQMLSGNIINYRIALVDKIGLEAVEWLEGPHEVKKMSIEDFKDIQSTYKAKCKEIEDSL